MQMIKEKYKTIAKDAEIAKTVEALTANGLEPIVVNTKEEALAKIKELIPAGASVMNGASKTLEEIGYIDYLKSGQHPWNNLHAEILAEKDPAKQAMLRRQSVLSDFYLGSVHALSEDGEFLVASNTGSQLPHIVFTSPNLIFVVGLNKLVPTLDDTFRRLNDHVVPLEDARMMSVHNAHTQVSKIVIFKKENKFLGRKVRMILVKEPLGF